jgi:hypothetical protein
MGQTRHFERAAPTSGLPRLADILRVIRQVSKVPIGDITALQSRLRSTAFAEHARAVSGARLRYDGQCDDGGTCGEGESSRQGCGQRRLRRSRYQK